MWKMGIEFLKDSTVPISTRIHNYREFLRDFRKEKQKRKMRKFREINGFDATDDDAKRKIVDELFYEVFQRYPVDDEERNEYTHSSSNMGIMKIGWRPL